MTSCMGSSARTRDWCLTLTNSSTTRRTQGGDPDARPRTPLLWRLRSGAASAAEPRELVADQRLGTLLLALLGAQHHQRAGDHRDGPLGDAELLLRLRELTAGARVRLGSPPRALFGVLR